MQDILLSNDLVRECCSPGAGHDAMQALEKARDMGCRIWIYSGGVSGILKDLGLQAALQDEQQAADSGRACLDRARQALWEFGRDKHWLAALAEDCLQLEHQDFEPRQLLKALGRLQSGALLLTRDNALLQASSLAVSPGDFLEIPSKEDDLQFVDLARQQDQVRPELERRLFEVLGHNKYVMGPEVQELEQELAAYTGSKHCLSCGSGTDALLLALLALDIGPGDAVLTTPFTFIATAEAIALLGATPVFVDIQSGSFNLDPSRLDIALQALRNRDNSMYPLPRQALQKKLTPRAILPVDLFGLPSDYQALEEVAHRHGLSLVLDAAQSLGAKCEGRHSCCWGDMAATSFFPAKPLGGYGEGGAVFCRDPELAEKIASIRNHGQGRDRYEHVRLGLNARLDSLQAAVLLAKLQSFEEEIAARAQVASWYNSRLSDCRALQTPQVANGMRPVWAQYSLLSRDRESRDRMLQALAGQGLPYAVHYPLPLHLQKAFHYLGYQQGDFPMAEDCAGRIFSLPMHPYLHRQEVDRVVDSILGGKEGA
ncbi:MAG: DegT/DnrJ/EryC1/StrS family aminotransferase [Desulfohalobiaceae bacterium]